MESGNVFSFIGRVIFIALFDNARMLTITINTKIMNVDSLPNSRYFFFIVLLVYFFFHFSFIPLFSHSLANAMLSVNE